MCLENERNRKWKINIYHDNSDIKVWIKKNNNLECEFTLKNGGESYDILEIKKNEVVALSGNNINFYDLNKRDKICSISGFESFNLNPGKKFCKANEQLLLVCGNKNFFWYILLLIN